MGRVRAGTRRAGTVVLTALAALVLVMLTPPAVPAAHAADGESWAAELAVDGGDDADVVAADGAIRLQDLTPRTTSSGQEPAEGTLVLAPRRVTAVVDEVAADVTADVPAGAQVAVAVRGLRADGSWGQWADARPDQPARLSESTSQVQVRITLIASPDGAGPALSRLWLHATGSPTGTDRPVPLMRTEPLTSRVFATRIGLVGNSTANGHRVAPDDRFVALPSRRGLSPQDAGDYTVEVCAAPDRCTWAPVWDVGPWNTTDDYWSTPEVRQDFADLPRGRPEAEAAFTDGYRGGRDGFGRTVRNPAGIDLADGTFGIDLGMRDNGWVTVTYLWTGTGPTGTSRTPTEPLTVRAEPVADASPVGVVAPRARMAYECTVATPAGRTGAGVVWVQLGPAQFVPSDQVEALDVPSC